MLSRHNLTGTLSTENIKVQKDTIIVTQLTEYFELISDIITKNKLSHGSTFKNTKIRTLFAKIDELCGKRFGINFKTVESVETLLGVQPTPPKVKNVLAGDVNEKYQRMKDYLAKTNTGEAFKDANDIDTANTNWLEVIQSSKSSLEKIDSVMYGDGLVVDLTEAKIYNYPSDAATIIHVNPYQAILKYRLTSDQLTAMWLHEIGHAFTHIEYAYSTVKNTITLLDSIASEVEQNKEPLQAIKLAYAKTYSSTKLDGATNVVTAIINIGADISTNLKTIGGNSNSYKESERLADQFAARFGCGGALGSALHTVYEIHGAQEPAIDMGAGLLTLSVGYGLFLALMPGAGIGAGLMGAGVLFIGGILVASVVFFLSGIIAALLYKGVDTTNPYDVNARRLLKIKNELVRQLRNNQVTKTELSGVLSTIDLLVSYADERSNDSNTMEAIFKSVGKLFKYASEQKEMSTMDNLLDDLMNNDLHIASNRLKTLM